MFVFGYSYFVVTFLNYEYKSTKITTIFSILYRLQLNHVIENLDLLILHRCKILRKDQTAKLVMSVTVYFSSLLREHFVIHYCVEPILLCCVFALSSSELNRANPKNINWIKLSYFYILFIFFSSGFVPWTYIEV